MATTVTTAVQPVFARSLVEFLAATEAAKGIENKIRLADGDSPFAQTWHGSPVIECYCDYSDDDLGTIHRQNILHAGPEPGQSHRPDRYSAEDHLVRVGKAAGAWTAYEGSRLHVTVFPSHAGELLGTPEGRAVARVSSDLLSQYDALQHLPEHTSVHACHPNGSCAWQSGR